MTKLPKPEELDAWIAWHELQEPKQWRLSTLHYTKSKCERRLTGKYGGNSWCNKATHESRLKRKLEKGWRIRPVKLVFLDESSGEEMKK